MLWPAKFPMISVELCPELVKSVHFLCLEPEKTSQITILLWSPLECFTKYKLKLVTMDYGTILPVQTDQKKRESLTRSFQNSQ